MTTSLDAIPNQPVPAAAPLTAPVKPNGSNGASTHGSNGNGETLAPPKPWSLSDATKLYGIKQWGQGYFSVNDEGHVAVHPTQEPNLKIDLKKLVDELRERDIQLPMLIRFTDILRHRVG